MTALPETPGRLPDNIVHFTRALRKAGVKVGTNQVEDAVRAVAVAGFTEKRDFYHTLRACLITRAEHLDLYDQVFAMFWRDPEFLENMIHMLSPAIRKDEERAKPRSAERRAAEALTDAPEPKRQAGEREELQIEASLSWSASERLRAMDFEQMSLAETREAEAAIRRLRLPVPPLKRSATATRPPLAAKTLAQAAPMPLPAPTTSAASPSIGELRIQSAGRVSVSSLKALSFQDRIGCGRGPAPPAGGVIRGRRSRHRPCRRSRGPEAP
ncbi:hypothetical protein [Mangrovicoccus ximenensis]|uniref:hypothetical protein n=1 Tax=Mangrovicoccus ximenensis TaxID=1911570 RepID=UPI001374CFB9|nr:hypothetical protein [Mangrovicoccus ximenensis]